MPFSNRRQPQSGTVAFGIAMDTAPQIQPQIPPVSTQASALPGWILLSMLPLTLLIALTHQLPGYIAGIPVWIAVLWLWPHQRPGQRLQSSLLIGIGALGLATAWLINRDTHYLIRALEANQLIVAMLVAVSFLRLVTLGTLTETPAPNTADTPPVSPSNTGRKALWSTLLGGHLIGAVINISAVMILGDRLSAQRPLSTLQGLVLLRAFSSCAVWSPFFASMGVVLISAPGAQLTTLMLYGLPVAASALLLSLWQIARHPDSETTEGYPMHLRALWIPLVLAALVMLEHQLWPEVSVLTLVTLTSLLFTLLLLPIRTGRASLGQLNQHVRQGLPRLGSEVTLFLAAAVLASGVGAMLMALDIQLAPEHFGAREASFTLIALVGLALIGMHPVTSAVLAGSILMPSVDDPNLLGITLLLGWSLGVGFSPFSGVQISLQSRYGLNALALMKLNRLFLPLMFMVGFSVISLYTQLHASP